ncbi:MAG: diguanylate cyclase [Actinomycetota bacterium]
MLLPLRVRLSVAFIAIVLVPLGVTAFLIQLVFTRTVEASTKDQLTRAQPALNTLIGQLDRRAAAAALDVAEAPAIQQGVRDGHATTVQMLVRQRLESARAAGVAPDFIAIAAPEGEAIASAGRQGQFLPGSVPPEPVQLATSAETSPYAVFARNTLRGSEGVLATVVAGFWVDEATLRALSAGTKTIDWVALAADKPIASAIPSPFPTLAGGRDSEEPARVGDSFVLRYNAANGLRFLSVAHRSASIAAQADFWPTVIPIMGVFAVLAGLLGWLLARLTTKPLEELSDAAMNIASGKYDTRIVVPPSGEVGRLAIAFNTMTDEVSTYIDALEHSRDELRRSLTRMGDTLSSTHDMNKMLAVILETAMVTLRAEAGALMLYTSNRDELYIKVGRGLTGRVDPDVDRIKMGEGVAGAVGRSGEPVHGTVGDRPGELKLAPAEPRARAVIAMPLKAHGRTLGVLNLYDKESARDFDDTDVATIKSFANQATVAIDNVLLHQESQRLSITDGLTGLWNYRYFQMTIDKEIERATRFTRPLSVLMLDLDKFKVVNDTHGHQRGDSVLIELATRIKGAIREVDTLARYGGEEFVLILPETDLAGAEQAAEKLCELVRQRRFGHTDEETLKLTVSIGVAVYPQHASTPSLLVKAADTALYAAKESGRDRYVVADEAATDTDDEVAGQLPPLDGRARSALESAAASVTASGADDVDVDAALGGA